MTARFVFRFLDDNRTGCRRCFFRFNCLRHIQFLRVRRLNVHRKPNRLFQFHCGHDNLLYREFGDFCFIGRHCNDSPLNHHRLCQRRTEGSGFFGFKRPLLLHAGCRTLFRFHYSRTRRHGAHNLIRHQNHAVHRFHIVYPHHVRAIQNRHGNRRRCGEGRIRFRRLSEKRFSRSAHENRIIETCQFSQPAENFGVLLLALAEAEARINHNACAVHSREARAIGGRLQFPRNSAQRILHRRQLAPSVGRAPHMVQNKSGITVGCHFRQTRVICQTAGIIENFHAILQRAFRNFRFVSVERKRNTQISAQTLQYWHQPLPLLVGGNPRRTGACRFGSYINDVCACFFQFEGAGVRAIGVVEASAVRE